MTDTLEIEEALQGTVDLHLVDFPLKVKAITVLRGVDYYDIYVNAGISYEMQQKTFDHEIEHVKNKDYDHFYDVNVLEHFR